MSARGYVLDKHRQGNITVKREWFYTDNEATHVRRVLLRRVLLHNHEVIRHDLTNAKLIISDCGWDTPTTRVAINRYFHLNQFPFGLLRIKGETQFFVEGKRIMAWNGRIEMKVGVGTPRVAHDFSKETKEWADKLDASLKELQC